MSVYSYEKKYVERTYFISYFIRVKGSAVNEKKNTLKRLYLTKDSALSNTVQPCPFLELFL